MKQLPLILLLISFLTSGGIGSDYDENLEKLYDELGNDKQLEELLEDYFLNRDKKLDHSHHQQPSQLQPTAGGEAKSCFERMHVIDEKIMHSKKSIENGAVFIDVKYVPKETQEIVLHENCMKLCCGDGACDTALLSLQVGEEGYRCYLFNCTSKCIYDSHKDYSVMTMNNIESVSVATTTVTAASKENCHFYEITCKKPVACIPVYDFCYDFVHCEEPSVAVNCTQYRESKLKPAATTTTKPKSTKAVTVYENLLEAAENLLEKNDAYDNSEQGDVEMYTKGDDKSSETLEDLLHKELFDSFKPKYIDYLKPYDDDDEDDDTNIFAPKNDKVNLKNKLNERFTTKRNTVTVKTTTKTSTTTTSLKTQPPSDTKPAEEDFSSGVTLAIFLLVIGISLTVGLFIFLALSSRYNNRRFRWPNFKYKNSKKPLSGDAEADYLINGMYL